MNPIYTVSKAEIVARRGRVISLRLGMEVETWEMRTVLPDETVLRMDKPISLRVRWGCHLCHAGIKLHGKCSKCEHSRCKECPRVDAEIEPNDESVVGMRPGKRRNEVDDEDHGIPEHNWAEDGIVFKKRSKIGGPDLVLRKPRHRVRRTCHVCQADFAQLSKTCGKCQHVRCTDCPRDPAKLSKYPFGYPGDVFGPNSIPYYECAKCWALYPVNSENGTPCRRCGEEKSDLSPRAQPRAVDADFDPTFLQKLEAKLDELEAEQADRSPDQ